MRINRRVGEEDKEKEGGRGFRGKRRPRVIVRFLDPIMIKRFESEKLKSQGKYFYFIHHFYFFNNIIFMKMPRQKNLMANLTLFVRPDLK